MSEFQITPPVERVPLRIPVNIPQPVFNANVSPVQTVAGNFAAARGVAFSAPAGISTHIGSFADLQQSVSKAVRANQDTSVMQNQVLQAFAGHAVFVSDAQIISRHLETVMASSTVPATQQAVRSLMTVVKQQHDGIKQQRMADFVQAACVNLQFRDIQVVMTNSGTIKVNASNLAGYAPEFVFAHEVRMNQEGEVILNSETLCLEDGSCRIIMEAFNTEMEKLGIPLRNAKRTPRVPIKMRGTGNNQPAHERKQPTKSKLNA